MIFFISMLLLLSVLLNVYLYYKIDNLQGEILYYKNKIEYFINKRRGVSK